MSKRSRNRFPSEEKKGKQVLPPKDIESRIKEIESQLEELNKASSRAETKNVNKLFKKSEKLDKELKKLNSLVARQEQLSKNTDPQGPTQVSWQNINGRKYISREDRNNTPIAGPVHLLSQVTRNNTTTQLFNEALNGDSAIGYVDGNGSLQPPFHMEIVGDGFCYFNSVLAGMIIDCIGDNTNKLKRLCSGLRRMVKEEINTTAIGSESEIVSPDSESKNEFAQEAFNAIQLLEEEANKEGRFTAQRAYNLINYGDAQTNPIKKLTNSIGRVLCKKSFDEIRVQIGDTLLGMGISSRENAEVIISRLELSSKRFDTTGGKTFTSLSGEEKVLELLTINGKYEDSIGSLEVVVETLRHFENLLDTVNGRPNVLPADATQKFNEWCVEYLSYHPYSVERVSKDDERELVRVEPNQQENAFVEIKLASLTSEQLKQLDSRPEVELITRKEFKKRNTLGYLTKQISSDKESRRGTIFIDSSGVHYNLIIPASIEILTELGIQDVGSHYFTPYPLSEEEQKSIIPAEPKTPGSSSSGSSNEEEIKSETKLSLVELLKEKEKLKKEREEKAKMEGAIPGPGIVAIFDSENITYVRIADEGDREKIINFFAIKGLLLKENYNFVSYTASHLEGGISLITIADFFQQINITDSQFNEAVSEFEADQKSNDELINSREDLAKAEKDYNELKTELHITQAKKAIEEGKLEELQRVITEGNLDINGKIDKQSNTLLHYAITQNEDNIITWLVDSGADVEAQNSDGDTPLHLIARKPITSNRIVGIRQGNILRIKRIIDTLTERSPLSIFDSKNKEGHTPAECGRVEIKSYINQRAEEKRKAELAAQNQEGASTSSTLLLQPTPDFLGSNPLYPTSKTPDSVTAFVSPAELQRKAENLKRATKNLENNNPNSEEEDLTPIDESTSDEEKTGEEQREEEKESAVESIPEAQPQPNTQETKYLVVKKHPTREGEGERLYAIEFPEGDEDNEVNRSKIREYLELKNTKEFHKIDEGNVNKAPAGATIMVAKKFVKRIELNPQIQQALELRLAQNRHQQINKDLHSLLISDINSINDPNDPNDPNDDEKLKVLRNKIKKIREQLKFELSQTIESHFSREEGGVISLINGHNGHNSFIILNSCPQKYLDLDTFHKEIEKAAALAAQLKNLAAGTSLKETIDLGNGQTVEVDLSDDRTQETEEAKIKSNAEEAKRKADAEEAKKRQDDALKLYEEIKGVAIRLQALSSLTPSEITGPGNNAGSQIVIGTKEEVGQDVIKITFGATNETYEVTPEEITFKGPSDVGIITYTWNAEDAIRMAQELLAKLQEEEKQKEEQKKRIEEEEAKQKEKEKATGATNEEIEKLKQDRLELARDIATIINEGNINQDQLNSIVGEIFAREINTVRVEGEKNDPIRITAGFTASEESSGEIIIFNTGDEIDENNIEDERENLRRGEVILERMKKAQIINDIKEKLLETHSLLDESYFEDSEDIKGFEAQDRLENAIGLHNIEIVPSLDEGNESLLLKNLEGDIIFKCVLSELPEETLEGLERTLERLRGIVEKWSPVVEDIKKEREDCRDRAFTTLEKISKIIEGPTLQEQNLSFKFDSERVLDIKVERNSILLETVKEDNKIETGCYNIGDDFSEYPSYSIRYLTLYNEELEKLLSSMEKAYYKAQIRQIWDDLDFNYTAAEKKEAGIESSIEEAEDRMQIKFKNNSGRHSIWEFEEESVSTIDSPGNKEPVLSQDKVNEFTTLCQNAERKMNAKREESRKIVVRLVNQMKAAAQRCMEIEPWSTEGDVLESIGKVRIGALGDSISTINFNIGNRDRAKSQTYNHEKVSLTRPNSNLQSLLQEGSYSGEEAMEEFQKLANEVIERLKTKAKAEAETETETETEEEIDKEKTKETHSTGGEDSIITILPRRILEVADKFKYTEEQKRQLSPIRARSPRTAIQVTLYRQETENRDHIINSRGNYQVIKDVYTGENVNEIAAINTTLLEILFKLTNDMKDEIAKLRIDTPQAIEGTVSKWIKKATQEGGMAHKFAESDEQKVYEERENTNEEEDRLAKRFSAQFQKLAASCGIYSEANRLIPETPGLRLALLSDEVLENFKDWSEEVLRNNNDEITMIEINLQEKQERAAKAIIDQVRETLSPRVSR